MSRDRFGAPAPPAPPPKGKVYAAGDFTGLPPLTLIPQFTPPRPSRPWDLLPIADPAEREHYWRQRHPGGAEPKPKGRSQAGPATQTDPVDARRQAVVNLNLYALDSPEEAARNQRMAQALCWPLAAVEADPEGALSALRAQEARAALRDAPATTAFVAHPANAAFAFDRVPYLADLERKLGILRRGAEFAVHFLKPRFEAGVDFVGRAETDWVINPLLKDAGLDPLDYDTHRWSAYFNRAARTTYDLGRGGVAGLMDLDAEIFGGVAAGEDFVARKVAQPLINRLREAGGYGDIDFAADPDPVQKLLLGGHDLLQAGAEGLVEGGGEAAQWGRKAGYLGGMVLVTTLTGGAGATAVFALGGMGRAADRARALGVYGTDEADAGILQAGVLQGVIGAFGGRAAAVAGRWAGGLVGRLGGQVAARMGVTMAPLAGRMSGPLWEALRAGSSAVAKDAAMGGVLGVASTVGQNWAQQSFDPEQRLLDGAGGSAALGMVLGGAIHMAHNGGRYAAEVRAAAGAPAEARAQFEVFETVVRAAAAEPLRTRAPERFAALIETAAPNAHVFVPVRAVKAAVAEVGAAHGGPEAVAEATGLTAPLEAVSAAAVEGRPVLASAAIEGDLAIPLSQYVTKIGPTPLHAALAPHIKLSAGGLSLTEAGVLETAFRHLGPAETGALRSVLETPASPSDEAWAGRFDRQVLDGVGHAEARVAAEGARETVAEPRQEAPRSATDAAFARSGPESMPGPGPDTTPGEGRREQREQRLVEGVDEHGAYYDIVLYYNGRWSPYEVERATAKGGALHIDETFVSKAQRGNKSARALAKQASVEIPENHDADHIRDIQLGGSHTKDNVQALPSSVNRSLGAQIRHLTKDLPEGTRIRNVTIKHRPPRSKD